MEELSEEKTLIMRRPQPGRRRLSLLGVGLGTACILIALVLTVLQPVLSQRATLNGEKECRQILERLAEQASATAILFFQNCARDLRNAAVEQDNLVALQRLGGERTPGGKPVYQALFLFRASSPSSPDAVWPPDALVPPAAVRAAGIGLGRIPGYLIVETAPGGTDTENVLLATNCVDRSGRISVAVALIPISALDALCGDLSSRWNVELHVTDSHGRTVLGNRARAGTDTAGAIIPNIGWKVTASATPALPRSLLVTGLWSISLAAIVFLLLVILLAARMVRNEARLTRLLGSANAHLRAYGGKLEQMVADQTVDLRHAKERAEEASRLKGEFLANMSHELRTPLNGIVGFAELMSEMDLPEDQTEYIRLIQESASALVELVNNVLDFAKMDADEGVELSNAPFSPGGIIDDVWHLFHLPAQQKNIRFNSDVGDLPEEVIGDELRLKQVVRNLLSNAIKFTPKDGEVLIRGRTLRETESGFLIEVSITDNGIGIPQDMLEIVFEPFRQVDASSTREYGGTGLGLALTRRLVEGMGGEIQVESKPGKGSRFSVTFTVGRVGPGTVPSRTGMV